MNSAMGCGKRSLIAVIKPVTMFLLLFCVGCHSTPTWSKASAKQRAEEIFIPDDAFYQSPQYQIEIEESVDTVIRLRKQLGHNADDRESLNRKQRIGQAMAESDKAARQAKFASETYAGSPNVPAKLTTMTNPVNAKGQIIQEQILTYYADGKMLYATNFVDLANK